MAKRRKFTDQFTFKLQVCKRGKLTSLDLDLGIINIA